MRSELPIVVASRHYNSTSTFYILLQHNTIRSRSPQWMDGGTDRHHQSLPKKAKHDIWDLHNIKRIILVSRSQVNLTSYNSSIQLN